MGTTFWDKIIDLIKIAWLIIISIISPIRIAVWVLLLFFTLNFFVGYKSDQIANRREFSLKKAFDGIRLLILYYALIFIVYMALGLYNEMELAEGATKFLTWVICYWYLVNIIRNARLVFPENEGLKFIYEILTVQVLDMLLGRFGFSSNKLKDRNIRDRRDHRDHNDEEEA